MYIDTTFPPEVSGRLAQFMRMVDAFNRDEIETAVEVLIAQLDAREGDPDLENIDEDGGNITDEPHDCDGDEEDHNSSEDDFIVHAFADYGPGCPLSDPGGLENYGGADNRTLEDDEDDAFAIRKPYRDYIRRTRCTRTATRAAFGNRVFVEWKLKA